MNHADHLVMPGHGWAVASWTILVVAAFLGLASSQTSQLFAVHLESAEPSIVTATTELGTEARLAVTRQDTFPIILTIPFAMTRTQRMMVARVKHHDEAAKRVDQLHSHPKGAPGFLASLALMGASQSSSR